MVFIRIVHVHRPIQSHTFMLTYTTHTHKYTIHVLKASICVRIAKALQNKNDGYIHGLWTFLRVDMMMCFVYLWYSLLFSFHIDAYTIIYYTIYTAPFNLNRWHAITWSPLQYMVGCLWLIRLACFYSRHFEDITSTYHTVYECAHIAKKENENKKL